MIIMIKNQKNSLINKAIRNTARNLALTDFIINPFSVTMKERRLATESHSSRDIFSVDRVSRFPRGDM
ncbi:MAG: hypothetical protein ACJAS9_001982 [Polaribacter sp.]|jgi:hypothetical protein